MKPRPLTSAEKLETQKGMRNKRNSPHPFSREAPMAARVLNHSAQPMMPLSPQEVSQSVGLGSKNRTSTLRYQIA